MSILIRNMEMPQSCYGCYFHEVYNYNGEEKRICEANWDLQFYDDWGEDFKHPDCPLIEVPTPHGRLIDAEWLKLLYDDPAYGEDMSKYHVAVPVILANIDDAPTIIESEEANG